DAGQFNRGISSDLIGELVDVARSDRPIYSLEAEFGYAPLFAARKLGLGQEWLDRLEDHDPRGRRALSINRVVAGTPAAELLRNGDMLLAIDGGGVTSFRGVGKAGQKTPGVATGWGDREAEEVRLHTVPPH